MRFALEIVIREAFGLGIEIETGEVLTVVDIWLGPVNVFWGWGRSFRGGLLPNVRFFGRRITKLE